MEAKFYRSREYLDIEKKGALMFYFKALSSADPGSAPFEFDGFATPEHIERYKPLYQAFLASEDLEHSVMEALVSEKPKKKSK